MEGVDELMLGLMVWLRTCEFENGVVRCECKRTDVNWHGKSVWRKEKDGVERKVKGVWRGGVSMCCGCFAFFLTP